MAELQALVQDLGYTNAATHLANRSVMLRAAVLART